MRTSTATRPAPSAMNASGTARSVPAVSCADSAMKATIPSLPLVDAAEAVVVAVVPGRVGVEHVGESGEVARRERLEAGADDGDVGGGVAVVSVVMAGSFGRLR